MLRSSNKLKFRLDLVITFIWGGFVLVAFYYFISQKLVAFDPQNKLTAIDSIEIESINIGPTPLILSENKMSVVHFTNEHCQCNVLTQSHITSINETVFDMGFEIKTIELNESTMLPSTPAIAIINELGELMYMGPYSSGLACSENNSFINAVLKNYSLGFNSRLIVNDTSGCYCNLL